MSGYNWTFLSYILSDSLSGYGNGRRIRIENVRSIERGDTSNNTELVFPSHYGTHIDFPLHFSINGKSINNYTATDFVFSSVEVIDLSDIDIKDYLISIEDIQKFKIESNRQTDFLIVKTGFCHYRDQEKYWKYGLGFDIGTANYLKQIFPNLKAIGFDLISLNSFQKRDIGREAHKEFLLENDLLIVEDINLTKVFSNTKINEIIIAPLRFDKAEGTPVTILAKVKND